MENNDEVMSDDVLLLLRNIAKYLKDGIPTDKRDVSFTELDFYSISNYSSTDLYHYLRVMPSREDLPNYKALIKYLKNFPLPVFSRLVDRKYYKGRPPLFIVRGSDTVKFGQSDFDQVFSILEEHHIPATKGTVMTAITRYALQEDIFPALKLQNSDKKEDNTHILGNSYVKIKNNDRKS